MNTYTVLRKVLRTDKPGNSACRDCPDVLNIDDACAPVPR